MLEGNCDRFKLLALLTFQNIYFSTLITFLEGTFLCFLFFLSQNENQCHAMHASAVETASLNDMTHSALALEPGRIWLVVYDNRVICD